MSGMQQAEHFMVYIWLRQKDRSPYYVGKTVSRYRVVGEPHSVHPPKNKANIRLLDCASEADALKLEMLLIRIYGRIDLGTGCLRNLTDGGEGTTGRTHTPEARAKMSVSRIGNTNSLGRTFSPETRLKMSAAKKGRPLTATHRQNLSEAQKGRKQSEETRARMSAAQKGRKPSQEARRNMRAAQQKNRCWLGRKHSEETRRKMSVAQKGRRLLQKLFRK